MVMVVKKTSDGHGKDYARWVRRTNCWAHWDREMGFLMFWAQCLVHRKHSYLRTVSVINKWSIIKHQENKFENESWRNDRLLSTVHGWPVLRVSLPPPSPPCMNSLRQWGLQGGVSGAWISDLQAVALHHQLIVWLLASLGLGFFMWCY